MFVNGLLINKVTYSLSFCDIPLYTQPWLSPKCPLPLSLHRKEKKNPWLLSPSLLHLVIPSSSSCCCLLSFSSCLLAAPPLWFLLLDFLCIYCLIRLRFFVARFLMYLLFNLATIFAARFGFNFFSMELWFPMGFLKFYEKSMAFLKLYEKSMAFLCNKCPGWIEMVSFWETDEFFLAINYGKSNWWVTE